MNYESNSGHKFLGAGSAALLGVRGEEKIKGICEAKKD
jgi:hypothetical protein